MCLSVHWGVCMSQHALGQGVYPSMHLGGGGCGQGVIKGGCDEGGYGKGAVVKGGEGVEKGCDGQ